MANFARILDGNIVELVNELPENWENVSGFRHASNNDEFINQYGWFRIKKNSIEYDKELQYISSYDYVIVNNFVEERVTISNIHIPDYEERKATLLSAIRDVRNKLLSATDWTQMLDLQEIKSEEWKTDWKTYRQALRDFPQSYQSIDYKEDIDSVIWPIMPKN